MFFILNIWKKERVVLSVFIILIFFEKDLISVLLFKCIKVYFKSLLVFDMMKFGKIIKMKVIILIELRFFDLDFVGWFLIVIIVEFNIEKDLFRKGEFCEVYR